MDFAPRRQALKPTVAAAPNVTPVSVVGRQQGAKSAWLWIILAVLVLGAIWALWQSLRPVSSSTTPDLAVTAPQTAPKTSSPTTDGSLFAPEHSGGLKIQIYDSGAGSGAVGALQDKLKALGYGSESLDKSQFTYDKTYIWYRAGLENEAIKIQSTMPERTTTLKQIASSGLFDILIYLGVK